MTDQVREELQMAARFTGQTSLQSVIDLAVAEFLSRQRRKDGFKEALAQAQRARARP